MCTSIVEVVGADGAVGTSELTSGGSGTVLAVSTRSSRSSPRRRSDRMTVGIFRPACATKAAVKTHAP